MRKAAIKSFDFLMTLFMFSSLRKRVREATVVEALFRLRDALTGEMNKA